MLVPGLLAYFATGFVYKASIKSRIEDLLYEGNTPFWKHAHRVPELDRVFFELDDNRDFKPSILHHGMSESQLEGFFPEFTLQLEGEEKKAFEERRKKHAKEAKGHAHEHH